MKFNVPVRMRNPWFWIGILGVVFTAMGINPDMLTSWALVGQAIVDLVSNPFMLGSVVIAVLGVFVDPTTAGVGDSAQAMTYTRPKK